MAVVNAERKLLAIRSVASAEPPPPKKKRGGVDWRAGERRINLRMLQRIHGVFRDTACGASSTYYPGISFGGQNKHETQMFGSQQF